MKQQDLINTCVFEQIQGLLFSDLSGPLKGVDITLVNLRKVPNRGIRYFWNFTQMLTI